MLTNDLFVVVSTGGMLLEVFLTTSASYTARRQWNSLQNALRHHDDENKEQDIIRIVQLCRNSFYFYLLNTLASRGTAVNRQLFFLTMVMQHKGLSRSGMTLLATMNAGLSPRSFDPELAFHDLRCAKAQRFVLNDRLSHSQYIY